MIPATSTAELSQRPSAWEWVQLSLLVANLAWTTLCLGGFRPETMTVTLLLTAALLTVHLLSRAISAGRRPFHAAGWAFLPFLLYTAVNAAWLTPVPWLGWRDWLGWANLLAVFWVTLHGLPSRGARSTLFSTMLALGFVAVVLAAYQRFVEPGWLMLGRTQADQFIGRASGPFGIPNSLAALLLLLLPPALALAFGRRASGVQRVLGGYLAVVFAFGLILTISRGAWLSLILVAVAWPLVASRSSLRRRFVFAALAVGVALGSLAVLYGVSAKVRDRIETLRRDSGERTRPVMWRGAWKIFEQHPAIGGGAGSYNVLFEKFRPDAYQDEPVWAHNDYLNTLADYGALGFLLFFGAATGVAWKTARSRPPTQSDSFLDRSATSRALAAGLIAFALQLFVDFHFKIPALAMAFAVMAALWISSRWPSLPPRANAPAMSLRAVGVALAAAVVVATVTWVWPFYRGESLRYDARQTIDRMAARALPVAEWRPVLGPARDALQEAVRLSPSNGAAWADLAYATVLWAHIEPDRDVALGREAEGYADRALKCSPAVAEFWIRRGVAIDLQGRWFDAGAAFIEAIKRAPARSLVWYHQAFHLSLDRNDPGPATGAVLFCLRLDPGNAEAQALRQRLAARGRTP